MNLFEFFKGSRKFTVMISIITISTIFRCFDLLTSPDFASLLSATGVAFMGSNAVERVMEGVREFIRQKTTANDE
jgi:hypothetical protein